MFGWQGSHPWERAALLSRVEGEKEMLLTFRLNSICICLSGNHREELGFRRIPDHQIPLSRMLHTPPVVLPVHITWPFIPYHGRFEKAITHPVSEPSSDPPHALEDTAGDGSRIGELQAYVIVRAGLNMVMRMAGGAHGRRNGIDTVAFRSPRERRALRGRGGGLAVVVLREGCGDSSPHGVERLLVCPAVDFTEG
ncbi:hypothetical protein BJX61DRAFT_122661 [Aspergillus egyptiacus]|nr:hypothetical protein BJX61DRAFT_122661 [Aspergillus egyptiacus]